MGKPQREHPCQIQIFAMPRLHTSASLLVKTSLPTLKILSRFGVGEEKWKSEITR